MNPEERYLFDLMGYLVVPNVLRPTEFDELNAVIDARNIWERLE